MYDEYECENEHWFGVSEGSTVDKCPIAFCQAPAHKVRTVKAGSETDKRPGSWRTKGS